VQPKPCLRRQSEKAFAYLAARQPPGAAATMGELRNPVMMARAVCKRQRRAGWLRGPNDIRHSVSPGGAGFLGSRDGRTGAIWWRFKKSPANLRSAWRMAMDPLYVFAALRTKNHRGGTHNGNSGPSPFFLCGTVDDSESVWPIPSVCRRADEDGVVGRQSFQKFVH